MSRRMAVWKYKITPLGKVRIITQGRHVKKNANKLKVSCSKSLTKRSSLFQLYTPYQITAQTDHGMGTITKSILVIWSRYRVFFTFFTFTVINSILFYFYNTSLFLSVESFLWYPLHCILSLKCQKLERS